MTESEAEDYYGTDYKDIIEAMKYRNICRGRNDYLHKRANQCLKPK